MSAANVTFMPIPIPFYRACVHTYSYVCTHRALLCTPRHFNEKSRLTKKKYFLLNWKINEGLKKEVYLVKY